MVASSAEPGPVFSPVPGVLVDVDGLGSDVGDGLAVDGTSLVVPLGVPTLVGAGLAGESAALRGLESEVGKPGAAR